MPSYAYQLLFIQHVDGEILAVALGHQECLPRAVHTQSESSKEYMYSRRRVKYETALREPRTDLRSPNHLLLTNDMDFPLSDMMRDDGNRRR